MRLAWLAICGLVLIPIGHARVFWGLSERETGIIPAADPGFRQGYTTDVRINGGAGRFILWGASRFPDEILTDLHGKAQRAGARSSFVSGGGLAWGMIVWPDGGVERFLVSSAEGRSAQVFHFMQDRQEYLKSREAPRALPFDAPVAAGGRLQSTFQNSGTGMTLATLAFDRTAAATDYLAAMGGSGWSRAPMETADATLYMRGDDLLVTSLKRAGDGAPALLLVLHQSSRKRAP